MTSTHMTMSAAAATPTDIGTKHIRWGLGLFIFGLVIGYGPWLHYMHGALEEVQPTFLKNVTLWFGCPWTLPTYVAQLGGLSMVAMGLCYVAFARDGAIASVSGAERMAPALCAGGILAEFVFGYPGYFAVNAAWPNFYFTRLQPESTPGSGCKAFASPSTSSASSARMAASSVPRTCWRRARTPHDEGVMRKRGYLDLTPAELRARRVAFVGLALIVMPPLLALCHVHQFLCQVTWDSTFASLVALAPLFPWMLCVAALMLAGLGAAVLGGILLLAARPASTTTAGA